MIPTVKQRTGMAELIALADDTSGREHRLGPHRGWTPTTCPGDQWTEWVLYLRDYIKEEEMTDAEMESIKKMITAAKNQAITVSRADLAKHKKEPHGGGGPHTHPHDHAVPASKTGVN